MFTPIEPFPDLRERVARALGWTVEETKQFSLSTLRDLVRPVSRKLARELTLAKDQITVRVKKAPRYDHGPVWVEEKVHG